MRHSDRWPHGAVVSKVLGGPGGTLITGTVLVLHRLCDDAPYRKVRIDGPGDDRIGKDVWPDDWVLGAGRFARTCLECQQAFRTQEDEADFCPCCDDAAAMRRSATTQGQMRADLHGTATKTLPPRKRVSREEDARRQQAINEQRAKDDAESIY